MKAPGVTRERLYLDTMQQIFANTTKVLIDSKSANPLLYLPFDKLLQQAAGEGTGEGYDVRTINGDVRPYPPRATG